MNTTAPKKMRDFGLEVFFSKWEFSAQHHMTASDMESLSIKELLGMASKEDKKNFENMSLGYTETWGAPDLRSAIANTYDSLNAADVLCLAGAGEGLYALAKVLLTESDHVVVPTPNYQSAETVPLSICEVTGVCMDYKDRSSPTPGWSLDIEKLKQSIRPNTKLISLNFPHNPTGIVMPDEDINELISYCRERGIYILIDEVYRGAEVNPANSMTQIADLYERGISLNVMSKAYGLPGLRIGWMASRDHELLSRVEKYKHYLSICNSGPSEVLAMIALSSRDQILSRNRKLIAENATLFETLLADYPELIEWQRPQGGCVAYPKYIGPGDAETFCKKLIEDSGVLLLPASTYTSELTDTPVEHFRIGIGRDQVFKEGLQAMRQHLLKTYSEQQT